MKYYIFFTRNVLPQPQAHLVQVAHSANAAANLGYPTVLVYLHQKSNLAHIRELFYPFHPQPPEEDLAKFYNLQDQLKVAALPTPWPIDQFGGKWTHISTVISKYYFPFHILPQTKIVHTRDWNFVKTAIKQGIPAIYEHHHHDHKKFEPEIVNHPLFQISVTVADPVRDSMVQNGMPPEKVIKLHNGFNEIFLKRKPEAAAAWRKKLLADGREKLVVYSGALSKFKGIDLLIDVAKELPQIQFVLAGGNASQVQDYQQLAREKLVQNVTFLGYLPQNELSSLLQASDILAHPHCAGKEASFTSPLKLFDYMASGTPIVATEIPPLMEFKSSPAVAAWCEADNPKAFAQSLEQVLLTHPRRVEGYTDNMDFVRQFSCENRIAKILSYLEDSMRPELVNW